MGNWVEKISCCFHSHSPTESSEKNPTQKSPTTTKKKKNHLGVQGMLYWNHTVVNLRWLSKMLLSVEELPCPYREPLDVCD